MIVCSCPQFPTPKLSREEGGSKDAYACSSQRAFHILRRSFMTVLKTPRDSFRPMSHLKALLTIADPKLSRWWAWRRRCQIWLRLRNDSGFHLPLNQHTVRDLVEWVSDHYARQLKGPDRKWRRSEVAEIVRRIIVDIMGTSQFTEDSRFREDIGVD
jgi:hypothetical protein